jgi:Tfp pilus assembly protein PilF
MGRRRPSRRRTAERKAAPATQSSPGATPAGPEGPSGRLEEALIWGLPPLLALFAYARTAAYGFSFTDDSVLLEDRAFLTDPHSIVAGFGRLYLTGTYYRPLVTVSFVLDALRTGNAPEGYHVTNVALHVVASVLVLLLLRRLRFSRWGAALAASLFAVHPALAESVAWIPGRNDTLLTVFTLASWLCLIADVERPRPGPRVGHVLFLLAALFTKETAVVLPVLFAVYVWSAGHAPGALRSPRLWPAWLGCVAAYGAARAVVGASSELPAHGVLGGLAGAFPALLSGLGKLCIPMYLSPLATTQDTVLWPGAVSAIAIAVAVTVARNVDRKVLLLALATFLLPLAPTLFVADRLTLENRLYLPAVGLCIFFAAITETQRERRPLVWAGVAAAACAGLTAVTWRYANVYQTRQALTAASVEASPSSAFAHLQRGDAIYAEQHDLSRAEAEYRLAIEIDPGEPVVHNNLAVVLMAARRLPEAEVELRKELEMNPAYAEAHYNLGVVMRQTGRIDEAVREWQRALDANPGYVNAIGELFAYYRATGNAEKAGEYMEKLSAQGIKMLPSAGRH